ncbi:MAG: dihydrolipoamide acetyltransferase family protein [Actinobacteria bacterium]|nr:dihydrolipoamide acetyltransferase family protein [Actinomycetota bacterium]
MAVTITMPQLGETVTEGTILSWAKQVGDTIAEDEVLVEISTDKVDTEMPSPASGVIEKILVEEGETVTVGTEIAVIADAADAAGGSAEPADEQPVAAEVPSGGAAVWSQQGPTGTERPSPEPPTDGDTELPAAAAVATAAAVSPVADAGDDSRRGVLSPVVRKLAAEGGVDLDQIVGTGSGGRITRKDVEAVVAAGEAVAEAPVPAVAEDGQATTVIVEEPEPVVAVETQPAEEPDEGDVELSKIRVITAERMVESKRTSAHVWTSVEVDFESVARARSQHGPGFKESEGFSLTYMPFISRATIDALGAFPVVNSSLDTEAGTVEFHQGVALGIAVDLNQGGLIVLTMKNADSHSLTGLAREIRGVAERARDNHLKPDDLATSTFTITNPGPFGSYMSAPIINQPNVAILSTDTVVKRPTVVTLPDGTDTVAIRHIGYLGLSWDHRAFDGSTAVLFLARIKENLQSWDWDQELR